MVNLRKPEPNPIELPETINTLELSEATRDILEHFGLEAPIALNEYCTDLEDVVVQLMDIVKTQRKTIKTLQKQLHINRTK